jgi:DNA-binding beta-propeller fold protein YncE
VNRAVRNALVITGLVLSGSVNSGQAQRVIISQWGATGTGSGEFNCPFYIAAGADGAVYVSDYWNNRIQRFNADGGYLGEFGGQSVFPALNHPMGLAVGLNGDVFVVAGGSEVWHFTASGQFLGLFEDGACRLFDVDVGPDGSIFGADLGCGAVARFLPDGTFLGSWPLLNDPGCGDGPDVWGLGVGPSGNVYVVDQTCSRIHKYSEDGDYLISWDAAPSSPSEFVGLWTAAVDRGERVHVTSEVDPKVTVFDSIGTLLESWIPHRSNTEDVLGPTGIAIGASGDVYVSYCSHDLVQRIGFGPVQVKSSSWGRVKAIYR